MPLIKRPVAHEKYAFTHSFYWLSAKFLTCPSGIWHKIDNLPRAKLERARRKMEKKSGFSGLTDQKMAGANKVVVTKIQFLHARSPRERILEIY